jgi:hypothetical protein
MRLREVKQPVRSLSFQQLVKLDAWLHSLIETAERASTKQIVGKKTYQSEMVRCGKKGCRCSRGELHGPYWYAYWTEDGKTRSEYVGKKLPRGVKKA